MNKNLKENLMLEIKNFREEMKTLILSTMNNKNETHASYAPFLFKNDSYYILISTNAEHANNLLETPQASIMIIEDESQSKQIFARKRLTFKVQSQVIERHDPIWQDTVHLMQIKLGNTVKQISNFSDFVLFELKADLGRYVKGFGQAYNINHKYEYLCEHVNQGHTKIKS